MHYLLLLLFEITFLNVIVTCYTKKKKERLIIWYMVYFSHLSCSLIDIFNYCTQTANYYEINLQVFIIITVFFLFCLYFTFSFVINKLINTKKKKKIDSWYLAILLGEEFYEG